MDWNTKLQAIIDYIETHLQRKEEPVSVDEIAKLAGCSYNFFQKVFSYMNGISLSEYIRFRKLTLAGYDLKSTSLKVVDISYKYGYDSPTSFTKAFQQFHGVSPKEARVGLVELRVYPKMQLQPVGQYSWRLESKNAMHLVGKSIRIFPEDSSPQNQITAFWSESQKNGVFAQLVSLDAGNPKGMFGCSGNYDIHSGEMDYSIMVLSDQKPPEGFDTFQLPEATWAIFDCIGQVPGSIQNGWKYLTEEWLLKYPFQHAECPELEWYSNGNTYSQDYLSQIWIPVIEEK